MWNRVPSALSTEKIPQCNGKDDTSWKAIEIGYGGLFLRFNDKSMPGQSETSAKAPHTHQDWQPDGVDSWKEQIKSALRVKVGVVVEDLFDSNDPRNWGWGPSNHHGTTYAAFRPILITYTPAAYSEEMMELRQSELAAEYLVVYDGQLLLIGTPSDKPRTHELYPPRDLLETSIREVVNVEIIPPCLSAAEVLVTNGDSLELTQEERKELMLVSMKAPTGTSKREAMGIAFYRVKREIEEQYQIIDMTNRVNTLGDEL